MNGHIRTTIIAIAIAIGFFSVIITLGAITNSYICMKSQQNKYALAHSMIQNNHPPETIKSLLQAIDNLNKD